MQAILVKYQSPTNTRGAGYTARASGGSVRVARDYGLSDSDDRARAALLLCAKLGWTGTMHEGGLPNGDHVFVFSDGAGIRASFDGTAPHQRRNRSGRSTKKRATKRTARRY